MWSKKELEIFINKELMENSLARKICKVVKLPNFRGWPNRNPIVIKKVARIDSIWEDDNEEIKKVINREIIDQMSIRGHIFICHLRKRRSGGKSLILTNEQMVKRKGSRIPGFEDSSDKTGAGAIYLRNKYEGKMRGRKWLRGLRA